jgi:hypothetical protein
MQVDSKNNLILNIKNKTQLYASEEVRKALEEYEKNKIATSQVSFCANHDRDTQEAIAKYYAGVDPYSPKKGLTPSKSYSTIFKEMQEGLEKTQDPVVNAVRKDLLDRSTVGLKKYNISLSRTDLSLKDWHQHLYEEILDSANYLKRIIIELESKETKTLLDVHKMD